MNRVVTDLSLQRVTGRQRLCIGRLCGVSFVLLLLFFNFCYGQHAGQSTKQLAMEPYTIYVSPRGSDSNDGTKLLPLKTIGFAVRKARDARRLKLNVTADGIERAVQILLEDGDYQPEQTVVIRPEDGGTSLAPTIMAALHPGHVTISGGREITGWHKIDSSDPLYDLMAHRALAEVYVASLPEGYGADLNFRQLWVGGHKAVRAELQNGGSKGINMQRILNWNHKDESCWIPKPADFNPLEVAGMEMVIHQWWAIANLRIKSARVQADSVELHFLNPESRIESEHPWPAPWMSAKTGNSAFYLSNAASFLDTAGEWYLDRARQKVYYIPRPGEDLSRDKVVFPYLTSIIRFEGTDMQSVTDFHLSGLAFNYSTWLRPSQKGHVPLQAGMYLLEAYKLKKPGTRQKAGLENQAWIGRPPGAVELQYTQNVVIKNCRFQHMASTGLDLLEGTAKTLVEGNLFKDIGGTGIQIGTYSPEGFETHLPYKPANQQAVCRFDTIRNNLVTDVTNEDWGCVGISAGYVHDERIEHNEVSDVSYSGICVGWGWTKQISALSNNKIVDNKVTHYAKRMYDVGGLYTLSAQPGTLIEGNYIDSIYKAPYPHDPEHWFYFYLDEGSSFITIKNNWCPALKVMKNSNGPGNTWENNGPGVPDSIKNNAGLEAGFKYLLKWKVQDSGWPIQPIPKIHND